MWKKLLLNCWSSSIKLGLMAHYHKLDCLVKRSGCSIVVKGKVTGKVQNSGECSPGLYFLNCKPFVTKLGMVMHHHGPECHAKRLVCYLQGQGPSEGSYNQI